MHSLFATLDAIHPLSEGLKYHLRNILKTKNLKKKGVLLEQGKTCNYIFFIEQGLFRCYYKNDSGKEVCSWFMKTGDVITSVESFFTQKPGNETIQALEDSIVHYLSYSELQHIYITYPEFNYIGRVLSEKYYCQSEQRLFWLRLTKASDRYRLFRDNYPELVQLIPSTHIASFLGITLETLSRVKSRKDRLKT